MTIEWILDDICKSIECTQREKEIDETENNLIYKKQKKEYSKRELLNPHFPSLIMFKIV